MLFTCVPRPFLHHARIRKLFGPSVKNTWIPTNTKELNRLVEEREQTAVRLEKAEITLIKLANAARTKSIGDHMRALRSQRAGPFNVSSQDNLKVAPLGRESRSVLDGKDGHEMTTVRASGSVPGSPVEHRHVQNTEGPEEELHTHPYGLDPSLPDVRGSVAAQWIPVTARPSHRPLANFGRKVDTIKWTRQRIKILTTQISKLRRQHRRGDGTALDSIFVEFDSQANAQAAYQILAHHLPLHIAPRFIGVKPTDVVWSSLRVKWWERIMRRFLIMGLIAVGILFWSIPSALVGALSNIKFLAANVPFLAWVLDLPSPVVGLLQGIVPALALSALMAAVPHMLRSKSSECHSTGPSNTYFRMCPSCRSTDGPPDRTLHPECIFRLPGGPGFPSHYSDFGCLCCFLANPPEPPFRQRPSFCKSSKIFQLLPLLHLGPVSWS